MQEEVELQLYRLLRREGGDAYSRYNALIRELVSFESALDQRIQREKLKGPKTLQDDGLQDYGTRGKRLKAEG
jgi:hypothetical protein